MTIGFEPPPLRAGGPVSDCCEAPELYGEGQSGRCAACKEHAVFEVLATEAMTAAIPRTKAQIIMTHCFGCYRRFVTPTAWTEPEPPQCKDYAGKNRRSWYCFIG